MTPEKLLETNAVVITAVAGGIGFYAYRYDWVLVHGRPVPTRAKRMGPFATLGEAMRAHPGDGLERCLREVSYDGIRPRRSGGDPRNARRAIAR